MGEKNLTPNPFPSGKGDRNVGLPEWEGEPEDLLPEREGKPEDLQSLVAARGSGDVDDALAPFISPAAMGAAPWRERRRRRRRRRRLPAGGCAPFGAAGAAGLEVNASGSARKRIVRVASIE